MVQKMKTLISLITPFILIGCVTTNTKTGYEKNQGNTKQQKQSNTEADEKCSIDPSILTELNAWLKKEKLSPKHDPWLTTCFNGYAQGPTAIKGERWRRSYYLINGKEIKTPTDTNKKRETLKPNDFTKEYAFFFKKLSEIETQEVVGGCKFYSRGFMPLKGYYEKGHNEHGFKEYYSMTPWFNPSSGAFKHNTSGGLRNDERIISWNGECKNGLINGKGVLTVENPFGYGLELSAQNGHIEGIIKRVNGKKSSKEDDGLVAFFYKTLWLRSYSEYRVVKESIESLLGNSNISSFSKKVDSMTQSGFKEFRKTEESIEIAEAALNKILNIKLAFSGDTSPATRWSDSISGLSFSGVSNSAKYYLNWNISPKHTKALPAETKIIKITLGVSLQVHYIRKNVGWAAFSPSKDKGYDKTLEITISRNDNFTNRGKAELFDVKTYTSTGSQSGIIIEADDIKPYVKLISVETK